MITLIPSNYRTILLGKTKWILSLGIYHRLHKRYGLVICPVCLAEDEQPYFRRLWLISFSVVCTKHAIWMLDSCPVCKSPIAFHRNDFEHKYDVTEKEMTICYECGYDYKNAERIVEKDTILLSFLTSMEQVLKNGYVDICGNIVYSHLYFDVIYQLVKLISINKKGNSLRYLLELEVGSTKNKEQISIRCSVDELSIDERRHALCLISHLMSNWPHSFVQACKKANLTKSRLEKDMDVVPFWYLQVLRNHLDKKSHEPSIEEIKSALKFLRNTRKKVSRKSLLDIMGYKHSKIIERYWADIS